MIRKNEKIKTFHELIDKEKYTQGQTNGSINESVTTQGLNGGTLCAVHILKKLSLVMPLSMMHCCIRSIDGDWTTLDRSGLQSSPGLH